MVGNFHLFNLFTPLVLKGQGKKVIAISSGMSDIDFIRQFEIEPAPAYAISKAGTNVLTAKFATRYAKEGVLFMSICPGSVDSGFEGECKQLSLLQCWIMLTLRSDRRTERKGGQAREQVCQLCSALHRPEHPCRLGQSCLESHE